MRYTIRKITEKDLDQITTIFINVFTSTPWMEPWTYTTAHHRLNSIIKTPGYIGIAYFDETDKIIGFLVGNEEQWADRKTFYINEICVLQNTQQTGIGTCLINELKVILKERKISSAYLSTERGLNKPEAFFQKNEFLTNKSRILMEHFID